MKYRPEIDGLRAVAVVPVILFHAGFSAFAGGYVGVDIFFVISGYLITSILLSELGRGTFSIRKFYERRARRILPALFFVMLVSVPLSWATLLPTDMRDYTQSLGAVSLFSSNVLFWREADYWDTASEVKPLLHTWSLAVEEQFYLLFPLFLIALRRQRPRVVFIALSLIATVSLAAAHWGATRYPTSTFYLLPTRSWELAIGAAIAFCTTYRPPLYVAATSHRRTNEIASLVGLALIAVSVFAYDKDTPFPSLYALAPTVGTGLTIAFASAETLTGRALGWRPLVGIGLISYSAYLWHHPLFAYTRRTSFLEPPAWVFVALIALTLVLAYASWRFVEQPFRDRKRIDEPVVWKFSAAGSLLFLLLATLGQLTGGFESRAWLQRLNVANYEPDNTSLIKPTWAPFERLLGEAGYSRLGDDSDMRAWYDDDDPRRNLLLVGDSHSKDLFNVLLNSRDAEAHFELARFGAPMDQAERLFSSPNYRDADAVVFVWRYKTPMLDRLPSLVERALRDEKTIVLVRSISEFSNRFNTTLADHVLRGGLLAALARGELSPEAVAEQTDRAYFDDLKPRDQDARLRRSDEAINAIRRNHPEVIVLDRMDYVRDTEAGRCFSLTAFSRLM